jgi:hypothetical protein
MKTIKKNSSKKVESKKREKCVLKFYGVLKLNWIRDRDGNKMKDFGLKFIS